MRNFKKIMVVAVFFAVWFLCNQVLEFMLVPYGYARVDFHNLRTVKYNDIYVGTSHGLSAINPDVVDKVTKRKSINFCMGGEYLRDSYYIVEEACRKRVPDRIVYELDPGYWVTPQRQDFEYGRLYEEMSFSTVKLRYFFAKLANADFRTTLFPWFNYRSQIGQIRNNIKVKCSGDYKNYGVGCFDGDGQAFLNSGFVYRKDIEEGQKARYASMEWSDEKICEDTMKYFKKLIKFCKKKGIQLVVITTPVPAETQGAYADEFDASYRYFTKLMRELDVEYRNFNYVDIDFDRGMNAYGDYEGHMYGRNAEVFSKILGEYLNSLSK